MSKTLIIGDMHFGDRRILRVANRPFKDLEDMEYTMIENWRSRCEDNDTIIVNGDFSLYGEIETANILKKLNGHKILVRGNHDILTTKQYLNCGFEMVYDYPIIVDKYYIVSHEPTYVSPNDSYANIFAHVHDNPNYKDYSIGGFCTSVERDVMHYQPKEWEGIKEIIAENNRHKEATK